MKPHLTQIAHHLEIQLRTQLHRHPQLIAGLAGGTVLATVALILILRARRPSAEELERRRREFVTRIGRITDGHLTDALGFDGEDSLSPTPDVLFYTYRLAGVTYNCAQDVSRFPDLIRGYRIDQPVQVRYDARNPGNSILVSETWSGLRLNPPHPTPSHPKPTTPEP